MGTSKILKNFDAINFRKHLVILQNREAKKIKNDSNKQYKSLDQTLDYGKSIYRYQLLEELLEDMELFAEFEKGTEENKNE